MTARASGRPALPGFEYRFVDVAEVAILTAIGGSGPPLLLLHGFPQTHLMWRKVAAALAARFTVVATDLRGYGDSSKPAGGVGHANYSKRAMAADQAAVMSALGFERFAVCGHDRGARVAHRLALDHPARVERLAVLDIAPTLAMYRATDMAFARAYYHWFFLIQPAPFPESVIGAAPAEFLKHHMGGRHAGLAPFLPDALDEYVRCFSDPATIHACCEDYRAAASIDLAHDEADIAAGRRLGCSVLALWGAHGVIGRQFDALACWRAVADDVRGQALDCGHYLAEEAPEALLAALLPFLNPS
jgi:haloacetate dehalogenase